MYVRNEVTDESTRAYYSITVRRTKSKRRNTILYSTTNPPLLVLYVFFSYKYILSYYRQVPVLYVRTVERLQRTSTYTTDEEMTTTQRNRHGERTVRYYTHVTRRTTHVAWSFNLRKREGLRLDLVYEGGRQVVCSDEAYHGLT
jgi:hypothetical protein